MADKGMHNVLSTFRKLEVTAIPANVNADKAPTQKAITDSKVIKGSQKLFENLESVGNVAEVKAKLSEQYAGFSPTKQISESIKLSEGIGREPTGALAQYLQSNGYKLDPNGCDDYGKVKNYFVKSGDAKPLMTFLKSNGYYVEDRYKSHVNYVNDDENLTVQVLKNPRGHAVNVYVHLVGLGESMFDKYDAEGSLLGFTPDSKMVFRHDATRNDIAWVKHRIEIDGVDGWMERLGEVEPGPDDIMVPVPQSPVDESQANSRAERNSKQITESAFDDALSDLHHEGLDSLNDIAAEYGINPETLRSRYEQYARGRENEKTIAATDKSRREQEALASEKAAKDAAEQKRLNAIKKMQAAAKASNRPVRIPKEFYQQLEQQFDIELGNIWDMDVIGSSKEQTAEHGAAVADEAIYRASMKISKRMGLGLDWWDISDQVEKWFAKAHYGETVADYGRAIGQNFWADNNGQVAESEQLNELGGLPLERNEVLFIKKEIAVGLQAGNVDEVFQKIAKKFGKPGMQCAISARREIMAQQAGGDGEQHAALAESNFVSPAAMRNIGAKYDRHAADAAADAQDESEVEESLRTLVMDICHDMGVPFSEDLCQKVMSGNYWNATSGDELDEATGKQEYGVRYRMFAGREGRSTLKEKWFATREQLARFCDKIEQADNFQEFDSYCYPRGCETVDEGYYEMPPLNRERYTDLSHEGLEGPFQTRNGEVLYYDPKEGKYYNRDSDMYVDYGLDETLGNAISGTVTGARIGSMAGPEGTVAGAVVGGGLGAMTDEDDNSMVSEDAEELNIGDEVVITGNVEYHGETGVIDDFGRDNRFVVVDLYNHGRRSFNSSDVSVNDSDDEDVFEGAKVDRMVGHIKDSEKKAGKSSKEAEDIAWATANKRGKLNNKNKVDESVETITEWVEHPEFDKKWNEHVPRSGEASSEYGEAIRALGRLEYEYFNNGYGNAKDDRGSGEGRYSDYLEPYYMDLWNKLVNYLKSKHAQADVLEACYNLRTGDDDNMKNSILKLKHYLTSKDAQADHKEVAEDTDSTFNHILARFPAEVKQFKANPDGDLADDLYHALYDYYFHHGEIPYGTAKGRDGDPIAWVTDRFYDDLGLGNSSGQTEVVGESVNTSNDTVLLEMKKLAGLK